MAGFASLSTTPASNTVINGTNVAENCPAGNLNDGLRGLAALCAEERALAVDTTTLMPKSGGAFSGQISRASSGGYLYNAGASQPGGAVYVLATGTALPTSPAEGTFVFFY